MDELLSKLESFSQANINYWNHSILFITFASLVAWVIWRFSYRYLLLLAERTAFKWDDLILRALKTPISVLIWCWPATLSLGLLFEDKITDQNLWLETIKSLMTIIIFCWIIMRLIANIEQHILSQNKHDETTIHAITKIARLFFALIASLTALQTFGISLSGLLAFGGVGGLVVGFAAQDLLSNFFGGLMIYFDRPFKLGDWIRSPDRQIEGTVERIGWRITIIRTFDKRPLYVPNSVFNNIVVENPSRMSNRRIHETIGVRYDDADKLERIVHDVKIMLENHPDIDANQTLMVNFNAFGASSLDFFIYTFTKTINWARYHEVKQDVLFKTMDIIHSHQADVAFPTQTLKVEQAKAELFIQP